MEKHPPYLTANRPINIPILLKIGSSTKIAKNRKISV